MKVQVHVQDINDNAPYFNESLYIGVVRENAEIGQNVLPVKAHDDDRGESVPVSINTQPTKCRFAPQI